MISTPSPFTFCIDWDFFMSADNYDIVFLLLVLGVL